jgi:hypothetical protein
MFSHVHLFSPELSCHRWCIGVLLRLPLILIECQLISKENISHPPRERAEDGLGDKARLVGYKRRSRGGKRDRVGEKLNESLFIKRFAARTKLTLGKCVCGINFSHDCAVLARCVARQQKGERRSRTDNSPARLPLIINNFSQDEEQLLLLRSASACWCCDKSEHARNLLA